MKSARLAKTNGQLNIALETKLLADQWQTMSDAEKEPLYHQFNRSIQRHHANLKSFHQSPEYQQFIANKQQMENKVERLENTEYMEHLQNPLFRDEQFYLESARDLGGNFILLFNCNISVKISI